MEVFLAVAGDVVIKIQVGQIRIRERERETKMLDHNERIERDYSIFTIRTTHSTGEDTQS